MNCIYFLCKIDFIVKQTSGNKEWVCTLKYFEFLRQKYIYKITYKEFQVLLFLNEKQGLGTFRNFHIVFT